MLWADCADKHPLVYLAVERAKLTPAGSGPQLPDAIRPHDVLLVWRRKLRAEKLKFLDGVLQRDPIAGGEMFPFPSCFGQVPDLHHGMLTRL